MIVVSCLWAVIFTALIYRARGHDWGIGTQANRVLFGLGVGLVAAVCAVPFWGLFVVTGWLLCVFGHGAHQRIHQQVYYQKFAHTEKLTFWLPRLFGPWRDHWDHDLKDAYQVVGMAFVGFVRMAVLLLPAWSYGGLVLAPLGLLFGPAYWIGWRVSRDWHRAWDRWPVPFRSGNDFGELIAGCVVGVVFVFLRLFFIPIAF